MDSGGGGGALFVKEGLTYKTRPDLGIFEEGGRRRKRGDGRREAGDSRRETRGGRRSDSNHFRNWIKSG
jgi:hypothetical protein